MPDDKTTNGNGNGAEQVEVYAIKGPLAGRRIMLPKDQVEAATGDSGWAVKIEPGNQLLADPGAPYDTSWVIPGYSKADLEPFSGQTSEQRDGAGKPTDTAKATDKAPAEEPAGSSSGSRTSSGQPAAPSATEQDAASQNGGASAPKPTTKTSTK